MTENERDLAACLEVCLVILRREAAPAHMGRGFHHHDAIIEKSQQALDKLDSFKAPFPPAEMTKDELPCPKP